MNNPLSLAFRSARQINNELPLSRFLPPDLPGSFQSWLDDHSQPGDWILDPLGSTPSLPLEVAASGRRVLVASNNPIITLMIEILASAPKSSDFYSALSHLTDTRKGSEHLEPHLKSLYMTNCSSCGQTIPADAFIWKRGENLPYLRLYHCPHCKTEGEYPITSDDQERLFTVGNANLHRARAIERINIGANESVEAAQEAIAAYPPRQLYFILTILNKIEGLEIPLEQKKLLQGLALTICDEGNAIWAYPSIRQRPKQILVPPIFRENNLWIALEEAVHIWSRNHTRIQVTRYPELPSSSGGICIYPGRLRNLLPLPDSIRPQGVISILPRPNQAFWTLSAIWTGWIWGGQAVLPLKIGLERRRYDWEWHVTALKNLFNVLQTHYPSSKIFGLAPELVPGFISAILLATSSAGYNLSGIALRSADEMAQMEWNSGMKPVSPKEEINQAIDKILLDANEPLEYLAPYTSALLSVTRNGAENQSPMQEPISYFQNGVNKVLSDSTHIKRYESTALNLESGRYWLNRPPLLDPLPLTDRIEIELVRFLQLHNEIHFRLIEEHLCHQFTGILTPEQEVIWILLSSYAEEVPNQPNFWKLRPQETSLARRTDLETVIRNLEKIGSQFNFQLVTQPHLCWLDTSQTPVQFFHPIASSIISRFLFDTQIEQPSQHIIVLPSSRAHLITYKLRRDPRLEIALEKGWHIQKFRYLRLLTEQTDLTFNTWKSILDDDPILSEEATQMSIFS
jgi:hypothetical protein